MLQLNAETIMLKLNAAMSQTQLNDNRSHSL